jgi:hypothetical protein
MRGVTKYLQNRELAEQALEPVGGLWPADAVTVRLEGEDWAVEGVGAAVVEAVAFWHSLVTG